MELHKEKHGAAGNGAAAMPPYALIVERKRIKHINLYVLPPDGTLKITAPLRATDRDIEKFLLEKRVWIDKHIAEIRSRPRTPEISYSAGDTLPLWGTGCNLTRVDCSGAPRFIWANEQLTLRCGRDETRQRLDEAMKRFCQAQLESRLPDYLPRWQQRMGVSAREIRFRAMKTRWGSCNVRTGRIWLNLNLVKLPPRLLEYVLVPNHSADFYRQMDIYLPDWLERRQELNRLGQSL